MNEDNLRKIVLGLVLSVLFTIVFSRVFFGGNTRAGYIFYSILFSFPIISVFIDDMELLRKIFYLWVLAITLFAILVYNILPEDSPIAEWLKEWIG